MTLKLEESPAGRLFFVNRVEDYNHGRFPPSRSPATTNYNFPDKGGVTPSGTGRPSFFFLNQHTALKRGNRLETSTVWVRRPERDKGPPPISVLSSPSFQPPLWLALALFTLESHFIHNIQEEIYLIQVLYFKPQLVGVWGRKKSMFR